MRSVASRLRTAVRSCHSSGKTYTLAQILLWWLVRWPDGGRGHDGPHGSPGRKTVVGRDSQGHRPLPLSAVYSHRQWLVGETRRRNRKETRENIADRIVSMPATIRRSAQNANVYRAYGIMSRHKDRWT